MTEGDSKSIAPADEGVVGTDDDGRAFIRFERHLRHPIDRVWVAISEPAEIVGWLCQKVEIEPKVGGQFTMWLGSADEQKPPEVGVITVFDPPHVLEAQFEDGSSLRCELRPAEAGCTLTFIDTRPPGERAGNSIRAGWHIRMEQLPSALDGQSTDWAALDATRSEHGIVARIEEIYWHYRNQPR